MEKNNDLELLGKIRKSLKVGQVRFDDAVLRFKQKKKGKQKVSKKGVRREKF